MPAVPACVTQADMQIFVGGTGRSGTTQLTAIIGQHPDVWHIPEETRFLVDPGGLEDLVRFLSTDFTPFHSCDALNRFRTLLTRDVVGEDGPEAFSHVDLTTIFGVERFGDWAKRFLADLTWHSFTEVDTPRTMGRYFSDRAELIALCRSYVDELFSGAAADHGKPHWCEKTPGNAGSVDFLFELFPDARIIYIVRHPVQVAASHLSMAWAPDNVEGVCNWLEPMYDRWLRFTGPNAERSISLRLEDLAAEWPTERAQLFARLGLPDAETDLTIAPDRVAHWVPISESDERYVRTRLGFAVDGFGYE